MTNEELDNLERDLRIAHRFPNHRAVFKLCDTAADVIKELREKKKASAPKRQRQKEGQEKLF